MFHSNDEKKVKKWKEDAINDKLAKTAVHWSS